MAKVSYPDIDKKFEKMSRKTANAIAKDGTKPTKRKPTKRTTKKGK